VTRILVAGSRVRSERSDAETLPLVDALARLGVDADVLPWDLPESVAGWSAADLVAVRTTWDYTERLEEFLAWADAAGAATRLRSPAGTVRWNSHKGYLVELAAAGVPVVPTRVVARGTAAPELGAGRLVVKPAVAAGGRGTHHGYAEELAEPAAALLAAGDLLVQPFLESVERDGEVSVIRIGDRWSHAVRKTPPSGGFLVHERHGGSLDDHAPTDEETAVAERALAAAPAPGDLVAARVDLVRLRGEPVVSELELIEPELFLRRSAGAPDRLAAALLSAATA
jgi:glutathione synthase/RimK-type ligase-like ATP-grasp enzyme